MGLSVVEDIFDSSDSGDPHTHPTLIRRFTLSNSNGMAVQVITYGATITSVTVPNTKGELIDVVLGFDDIAGYLSDKFYIGSTIGRCANRIKDATFVIDGVKYSLDVNIEPNNHLHGGCKGFNKVIWDPHVEDNALSLSYTSPSGESGYPGEVRTDVCYQLTEENELIIKYRATSTEKTPINLTNHSYFNLGGHNSGTIQDHVIWINADNYTPLDDTLITTGEIRSVEGTPLDLRCPRNLGEALSSLKESRGFDHNFCINGEKGKLRIFARVSHPATQIQMEVLSTQAGVQFYTSNFLPEGDELLGKGGAYYRKHGAFCLETQNYPDAVNKAHFPNCIFGPKDLYEETTVYKFTNL